MLNSQFRKYVGERPIECCLVISDNGLVLGVTVLAKFHGGSLKPDEGRVLVLLSIAAGRAISSSALGYIRCAEKYHACGNTAMSGIALALTGVPMLQKMEQVEKLFYAELLLQHGTTPLELLKIAGIENAFQDENARALYKFLGGDLRKAGFNEDEPRDDRGRWTNEGGGRGKSKWGRPHLLGKHYKKHGASFEATSEEDYTNKASDFFNEAPSENLSTKVDSRGVARIYDPETNTFGSYNPDGTIRTFFKPADRAGYFESQPGINVILEAPAPGTIRPIVIEGAGGAGGSSGDMLHPGRVEPEG